MSSNCDVIEVVHPDQEHKKGPENPKATSRPRSIWPESQKREFITDWLNGKDKSFAALCRRHGIQRSKGYKWRNRYLAEGMGGLAERSRAPLHHPNQTPEPIRQQLIEERKKHPNWGAGKLIRVLAREHPNVPWPATSTAHEILRRAGLVRTS